MADKEIANKAIVPKKEEIAEIAITYWMDKFQTVYEKVDSHRPPVNMWIAATTHFSAIGESIRRMHFTDLISAASHAFCWMCSFVLACRRAKGTVFSINESFSGIVTCKYPLVCGHCQEAYCHCNPRLMDAKSNKAGRYRELLEKRNRLENAPDSYTVSRWLSVFGDIFGQHIHMLTLESIGFHFLEEAGEELAAIRNLLQLERVIDAKLEGIDANFLNQLSTWESLLELYDKYKDFTPEPHMKAPEDIKARLVHAKVDMYVEFADTFSWFCSILNKVASIAKNCDDDNCHFTKNAFQDKLIEAYLLNGNPVCSSCKKCPCDCGFFI